MNTSKNNTGILLAAIVAGFVCVFGGSTAYAAQSTSFAVDGEPSTYGEHAAGTSGSFQLSGGMTWKQNSPLASNSFQIVTNPAAQTSSVASQAQTSSVASTTTVPVGGHRGSSASSVASLHPAASSVHSTPRSRASRASAVSLASAVSDMSVSDASASSVIGEETVIIDTMHPAAGCPAEDRTPATQMCRIFLTGFFTGSTFGMFDIWLFFALGFVLGLLTGILGYRAMALRSRKIVPTKRKTQTVKKKSKMAAHVVMLLTLATMSGALAVTYSVNAAGTTPQRYVYNGHLLNSSGQPITTAHSIRFSFWKSADLGATDIAAGVLNTAATTYAGWQEVATVTPDANGYFSVQLGAVTALPALTGYTAAELQSLFLQVEVKAQAAADTSYEVLDVDTADAAVDRSPIQSVPFAGNADTIDQREIGTGSGSIPLLGPNGKLPSAAIPSELNGINLTLDNTNSATGSISLQFGATLAKKLSYDTVNNRFNFNDAVRIQGNLTVLGLINGVDVTNLGSSTGALRVFSGGGLNIRVSGGSYRLAGTAVNYIGGTSALTANTTNYVFFGSGGLTVRTMPFPTDESYIALAEVVTGGGAVNYILDRRALMSDDRQQLVETTLHPQYPDAAYSADGSDNVGQLSVVNDAVTLKNSYLWTSTRPTLQDYDVVLRLTLPTQFTSWKASPLTFLYKSSSADSAITKMDVAVFDTAGNAVTLTGTSTNLANTAWTSQTIDFSGAPTWTPGGAVVIRFRLSSKDSEQMQLGDLTLKYQKLAGQ